jgi:hypothetical protein
MMGFIYRRAIGLKEFGERLAHIKAFGTRPFLWASGPFIRLGISLRVWAIERIHYDIPF